MTYAAKWPNITQKGAPPVDADAWKDVPGKFAQYFSPAPGKGE
jgi:ferredoxin